MIKIYLKGTSGIFDPVDIKGSIIKAGDLLTTDYGDNLKYGIPEASDDRKNLAFYLVKEHINGGLFAESIEPMKGAVIKESRFYLHDFRFKYCKKINSLPAKG